MRQAGMLHFVLWFFSFGLYEACWFFMHRDRLDELAGVPYARKAATTSLVLAAIFFPTRLLVDYLVLSLIIGLLLLPLGLWNLVLVLQLRFRTRAVLAQMSFGRLATGFISALATLFFGSLYLQLIVNILAKEHEAGIGGGDSVDRLASAA